MSSHSLSVVMATYNGDLWVGEQLQSIALQTRLPDELIVSDDGSTDRTMEIVEEFSESAPFAVRIVKGPSKGLAENFWSASSLCSSEFISWSDQDDLWYPEKLEVSERTLLYTEAGVASHSAIVVDEKLNPVGRHFPNYRSTHVLDALQGDPWQVLSGFTVLFRRNILSTINWINRPRSHQTGRPGNHDHTLSVVAFATERRVEISKPLALYRQHSRHSAGAPPVDGVRQSIQIGLREYRALADYAREYERFVELCGVSSQSVNDYYEVVAKRCDLRADIYASTGFLQGLGRLGIAAVEGAYGSRRSGRFRPAAFAKDATEVGLKLVSSGENGTPNDRIT
jgi:glycosyltransferase involved in cell wall biosynthesis